MLPHAKQLVVTPYHPWRKWAVLAILVVSVPAAGWGLFDYGRYRAGFDSHAASQEEQSLRGSIEELQRTNDELRQHLANSERARDIDKHAYADVNATLESMQTEISELKEEVAFYRGIATPQAAAQGVQIQSLRIVSSGAARGLSYKLVLVQTAKDAAVTRGSVRLKVQGLMGQTQKEYSFSELSGKNAEGEKFSFKYFEKTEGDIMLPPGFIPTRVMVHVSVDVPKPNEFDAAFPWQDVSTS